MINPDLLDKCKYCDGYDAGYCRICGCPAIAALMYKKCPRL